MEILGLAFWEAVDVEKGEVGSVADEPSFPPKQPKCKEKTLRKRLTHSMLCIVSTSLKKSHVVPTGLFAAFFIAEIIWDDRFSVPRLRVGFGITPVRLNEPLEFITGGINRGDCSFFDERKTTCKSLLP